MNANRDSKLKQVSSRSRLSVIQEKLVSPVVERMDDLCINGKGAKMNRSYLGSRGEMIYKNLFKKKWTMNSICMFLCSFSTYYILNNHIIHNYTCYLKLIHCSLGNFLTTYTCPATRFGLVHSWLRSASHILILTWQARWISDWDCRLTLSFYLRVDSLPAMLIDHWQSLIGCG